jgi:hypothetical protein
VIDRLPAGDPEAQGRVLFSTWCAIHGADYCDAVMSGQKKRDDVEEVRKALYSTQMTEAIRSKARTERESRRARLQGLRS